MHLCGDRRLPDVLQASTLLLQVSGSGHSVGRLEPDSQDQVPILSMRLNYIIAMPIGTSQSEMIAWGYTFTNDWSQLKAINLNQVIVTPHKCKRFNAVFYLGLKFSG